MDFQGTGFPPNITCTIAYIDGDHARLGEHLDAEGKPVNFAKRGGLGSWRVLGRMIFLGFFERRNFLESDMGVSKKTGVFPPKWMVKIMEKTLRKDIFFFLGKHPPFEGTPIY